ncbi:MAG TPA: hypothetical protein VFK40_00745 [Nitrososphaeraceae archaeon]|nr:hypothetical protein [Nitrososphaeraceae archaeon]
MDLAFEETYDIKFIKTEIEWIITTLKQTENFMDTFPQEIGLNDENNQEKTINLNHAIINKLEKTLKKN